jgi:hypothetical protein
VRQGSERYTGSISPLLRCYWRLFRFLRCSALCAFFFDAFSETPATCSALETLVLLFSCDRWSAFETKHLIHWLSRRDIIVRKPTLTVEGTGIFVPTPITIFFWIDIYRIRQADILPNSLRERRDVTMSMLTVVYHTVPETTGA